MDFYDFHDSRQKFNDILVKCLTHSGGPEDGIQQVEETFQSLPGSDNEKKNALDQACRDQLKEIVGRSGSTDECLSVVNITATAVQHELCNASMLFVVLQDVFDCFTLDKCENVFSFLEDKISMWKSDTFYNAGKNYLLRMCNDLLRRLSRSKNTVFCGRIQLFLANLFPLSEKSGLNIMSQFNIENVTLYNTKAEDYEMARKQSVDEQDESMEVEEGETDEHSSSSIPIDYNLYRKFWSLQDSFRKPVQLYDKAAWKTFTSHSDDVLTCFDSFKLEDSKAHKRKKTKQKKATDESMEVQHLPETPQDHVYFAKYLTSEKLLDLQLSDSNFRRYVLVQILIVFQYLNATVKFKSSSHVLTDEQMAWIKTTTERVTKALRETHPDGNKFTDSIEHILSREENWNNWKNDNCPSFIRDKEQAKAQAAAKKRTLGEDLKYSGGKIIKMGNSELTRLWNLCPENMEACRADNKNSLPSMDEFFEEAIEQMDPEAMIEDEYKLVKNPTFAWKSLRLLSRRSSNFFSQASSAQKKKSVPQFLETMLAKLVKEMPSAPNEDVKEDVEDGVEQEAADAGEDQLSDPKPEDDDSQSVDEDHNPATKDQIQAISEKLSADWKKLASELGFPEDDVSYIESETDDKEEQAQKMLTLWMESDEKNTVELLRAAMREIGQETLANEIFGEKQETLS